MPITTAEIDKQDRVSIVGIKVTIRKAIGQFDEVGNLGMRNSEKLVEAQAELFRAEKKLNFILDSDKHF